MDNGKTVLALFAHPDDAEFVCAGTLALLHQQGWKIHIATMTAGDVGSTEHSRQEISRIRKAEAAKSAHLLDGTFHCLECNDVFIMYDPPTLTKTIALIRNVQPTLVFTAAPVDYMVDHEITSRLAKTACFTAGIPNIDIDGTVPHHVVPYLYYCDPIECKDGFGRKVESSLIVNITERMQTKERMLRCHDSQRQWLAKQSHMDNYIDTMKSMSSQKGELICCTYAEGFRQHLGHGFPQDNILKNQLNHLVHRMTKGKIHDDHMD